MMGRRSPRYNEFVLGGWWRGALATLVASMCCLAFAAPVCADETFAVGPAPILNLHVPRGQVTIQTWDRPQVLISSEKPVDVRHLDPGEVDASIPKELQIASDRIQTEHGPVTLPAEPFVMPQLPGGGHDEIMARGSGRMTITIPRGTAMVMAQQRAGHLTIANYHGVFVAHARAAGISLNNVSGTGFVESLRGQIVATNSSFDRLRIRTATGDMLFQGCSSQQIQATSAYGSIVYDNGDFQPGLARFESEHGNVALGVRGGAQIGAHSGSGQVVSNFADDAQVRGDPTTKQATVGGGGPVVTATSRNGSVYLYSGSMNENPRVRQELNGSTLLPTHYPNEVAPNVAPSPVPPPRAGSPARPPNPRAFVRTQPTRPPQPI
jgi:Putative adhesin